MNYYENMLKNIEELVELNPVEAYKQIEEELDMPYVPKDVFNKLLELKSKINIINNNSFTLSEDDIIDFLHSNEQKQIIAVNQLDKLNLRDHLDICKEFLISDGNMNAKVFLISSLINQDINEQLVVKKDNQKIEFNPSLISTPENTKFFNDVMKLLSDHYFKNPDMLRMSQDILYRECMMYLPLEHSENEADKVFKDIVSELDNMFN